MAPAVSPPRNDTPPAFVLGSNIGQDASQAQMIPRGGWLC